MKKLAFLSCCFIIAQTAFAQTSGGQIVRKKSSQQIQSTPKTGNKNTRTKYRDDKNQFNLHISYS